MNIDAVIEKIKKAVRLARGTTEAGERDAALRLARALAEKNGLAFDDIDAEAVSNAAVIVNDSKHSRLLGREVTYAIAIIKAHFGVYMVENVWKDGRASFTWFGTKINIDIARYVFHILIRESRNGWKEARKVVKKISVPDANLKDSFMRGFFSTIWQRLSRAPLRNDREQFLAEQKSAEKKYDEFLQNNAVKDRKRRGTNSDKPADGAAIMMGVEAGEQVSLARPCGNAPQNSKSIIDNTNRREQ